MVPVVSRKIKFSPGRKKSPWIIPVVLKKYINGPSVQFRLILGVRSGHVHRIRGQKRQFRCSLLFIAGIERALLRLLFLIWSKLPFLLLLLLLIDKPFEEIGFDQFLKLHNLSYTYPNQLILEPKQQRKLRRRHRKKNQPIWISYATCAKG